MSREPSLIPAVAPPKAMRLPPVAQRILGNGIRVLVVRRPGVPRFEARLHIPAAQRGKDDGSKRRLLTRALTAGTATRSSLDLARDLQTLGASLDTSTDADDVILFGSALSTSLAPFLELMAEVVTSASYPSDEVTLERDRLAQEIVLARSQPATIAREALAHRIYGDHAYGRGLPEPDVVRRVSAGALRSLHAQRLLPRGAVLVIVGDVRAPATLDRVEAAFSAWADGGTQAPLSNPKPPASGPTIIVNRPAAVQTNVRMGVRTVRRGDPDHPALTLANLVFGGYFSSRLVDNIRERRGYTYSPGSVIQQHRAAAHLAVVADVGTEVTAPALVEIRYELGRMVTTIAEDEELDAAKRYLAGNLAMATQTQAGLASYLAMLEINGLTIDYLRELPLLVQKLSADEVQHAAWRYLAPRGLATVLVGDADAIHASVSAFEEVEVVAGE